MGHLLFQTVPGDVVACMAANQEAREAYWGAYPSISIERTYSGEEAIFRD